MPESILILSITAATIALFHTLLGPDHYLPFIVMGRSRQWSDKKTVLITLISGIGHVPVSIFIGLIGVTVGVAIEQLEYFESVRGNWAAWALIAFGLTYTVYSVFHAVKNRPHIHMHMHSDKSIHSHEHIHHKEHVHLHNESILEKPLPWVLFVIFVMG